MSLVICPECGKEISEKASICPNCGYPILSHQTNSSGIEDNNEYIFCPKCLSTKVHTEQKGFSGGKAFVGAVTLGALGVLAGTIGSDKVNITCLKCGHKFKAGDAIVASRSKMNAIIRKLEDFLGKGDKLDAVRLLNGELNWNNSKSLDFINSYVDGHPEIKQQLMKSSMPKTKIGIIAFNTALCIIVLLMLLGLFSLVWSFFYSDYEWDNVLIQFWLIYSLLAFFVIRFVFNLVIEEIRKLDNKKN